MNISVFGLGYVGTVTSACLANEGYQVTGIDINREKIDQLNAGKSPIVEDKIGEIIADVVERGKLKASFDVKAAINGSKASIICVGTPSKANGDVDLSYIIRVSEKIGNALKNKTGFHTLIYRSTVPPGTTEEVIIPILEETAGKKIYLDFDVCFNPEFLREGASVDDFYNPPFTVIGHQSDQAGEIVADIFSFLQTPLQKTTIRAAEMLKYACNSFHALKVAFANEIGTLCRLLGIDGYKLMYLLALDRKQNISDMYLKPGFAFGGSCLPKDLRGLTYLARQNDYDAHLLSAISKSNNDQLEQGYKIVTSLGRKKVGFLGLSFKGGTDDLRESPLVLLAEKLIGKGYELLIYDNRVNLARLHGSNKSYIEKEIPHIGRLFVASADDVVFNSEVIIVGNHDAEYIAALKGAEERKIVGLVRIDDDALASSDNYHGICW